MYWVNELIGYLSLLPLPIVDWLYFDFADTVLVYAIILFLSLAFDYEAKKMWFLGLMTSVIFFSWVAFKDFVHRRQHRLVVYEIKDKIAIDLVKGKSAVLLVDRVSSLDEEVVGFQVNPFRLANGLPPMKHTYEQMNSSSLVEETEHAYLIKWEGLDIFILKHEAKWPGTISVEADIIYLDSHQIGFGGDFTKQTQVILGSSMEGYHHGWLTEKLANWDNQVHNLKYDGYFTKNLREQKPVFGHDLLSLYP